MKHATQMFSTGNIAAAAAAFLVLTLNPVRAKADQSATDLRFQNGHFEPAALSVAAGERVQLKVTNGSEAPIEFESFELNRERVVPAGGSIVVNLPKMDAGEYHFFDDFHHEVPQGTIVAR